MANGTTDRGATRPLEKPDLYVIARFLDRLWQPEQEYTKNQLQMAVRLNYDLFRRYLAFLVERGFVTVGATEHKNEVVRITAKGVEAHRQLVEWIRRVLGESVL